VPASLLLPSRIKIARLWRGEMPIYEPDLGGLVAANTAAGRLTFATERMPAIEGADAVFIAVDTPRARRGGNSGIMKQTEFDLPRQPNVCIPCSTCNIRSRSGIAKFPHRKSLTR
jgi:hypothetical protein